MKFSLASLKKCFVNRIKFLFRLFFALIGLFFTVYIHSWLSEQFSGSQAGYGKLLETRGYQKAGTTEQAH